MLLDDFGDVINSEVLVPSPFRINHSHRTLLAVAQALGGRELNRFPEVAGFDPSLEGFQDRSAAARLTRGFAQRGIAMTLAYEEMISGSVHGDFGF